MYCCPLLLLSFPWPCPLGFFTCIHAVTQLRLVLCFRFALVAASNCASRFPHVCAPQRLPPPVFSSRFETTCGVSPWPAHDGWSLAVARWLLCLSHSCIMKVSARNVYMDTFLPCPSIPPPSRAGILNTSTTQIAVQI